MEGCKFDLVSGDWIQERRNPFVEETKEHREVDHERATKCLDVVLLQNVKDLYTTPLSHLAINRS